MTVGENEPKIPLLEMLDDAIRSVVQSAKLENMAANPEQFEVLQNVCNELSNITGGKAKISLYPMSPAGYVTVKLGNMCLYMEQISRFESVLNQCTVMGVDPLLNGDFEFGVTIPNVFFTDDDD